MVFTNWAICNYNIYYGIAFRNFKSEGSIYIYNRKFYYHIIIYFPDCFTFEESEIFKSLH
jgi:hypothetical protein